MGKINYTKKEKKEAEQMLNKVLSLNDFQTRQIKLLQTQLKQIYESKSEEKNDEVSDRYNKDVLSIFSQCNCDESDLYKALETMRLRQY